MAIERRRVAAVTRSWGGTTGEAIYKALRVPTPPTEGSLTVRLGNYSTAGEAMRAVHNSVGIKLEWRRNDLTGDIENYDGYYAVSV